MGVIISLLCYVWQRASGGVSGELFTHLPVEAAEPGQNLSVIHSKHLLLIMGV